MNQPTTLTIRNATKNDVGIIYQLIRELAEYEKLLDKVESSEKDIDTALFGKHPCAECILAFENDVPAGFALFFTTFSTFVGKPGIYLEDLYVKSELRGRGIGKALLSHLANIALERNCGRLEWAVLDWNEPAIRFYQHIGAIPMDEWTVYRLTGDDLKHLAQSR